VSNIKLKLVRGEADQSLKAKDAEVSSAKMIEEISGKYIKEISNI
jgi:hypothetical protein